MRRGVRLAVLLVCGSVGCGDAPPRPATPPRPGPARARPAPASVILDASSSVVVAAPADVMDPTDRDVGNKTRDVRDEGERRRVRESVKDLARVLGAASGATVRVQTTEPLPSSAYTILVGDLARAAFGAVGASDAARQGFRVVVEPTRAGLYGESNLAVSYAVYELCHRIGARWYFPGDLGEVLPARGPIELAVGDERRAPSTLYRGVWYADEAWKRRNRTGGVLLSTGHALDHYFTDDDRRAHPEWAATSGGRPLPGRVKWSPPGVAEHVARRILDADAADPADSYSLSVEDGDTFDDSADDRALDAADRDPTTNRVSITDRFVVLANRVASRVAEERDDLLLGFLAYASTGRPPVRERLHRSLVPQIAPITYARAHPIDDDGAPHNAELRATVEGWARLAPALSYYAYGYFLAEPVAPNPMRAKWGRDVPYLLRSGVRYWQPETLPNFETSMHALVMATRVTFDARERPEDVYDEIDQRLYGAAAAEMAAYWRFVDDVWTGTPEYGGGKWGQLRRFTKPRLDAMRALLAAAARRASRDAEHLRIAMAEDSLSLFDELMQMRRDFAAGSFGGLDERADRWAKRAEDLAAAYESSSAFTRMPWTQRGLYAVYFDMFDRPAFVAGARVAKSSTGLQVLRAFRWQKAEGAALGGREERAHEDAAWSTTDVSIDTWASLGLYDHFGPVWYRARFSSKRAARARLFLSAVFGAVRVFVNGREARHVPLDADAAPSRSAAVAAQPVSAGGPLSFDVSRLLVDGDNVVAIVATRTAVDELGVGGLMGPVVLHRPR